MVKAGYKILLLVFALLTWSTAQAEVSARLERDQIRLNETVRLVIESNSVSGGEEPDLTSLSDHFNVLGTSTSQNISIVNGAQSATRRWIVELQPKSIGSFSFGPITVGQEQTALLRLAVLPEQKNASSSGAEVFIEAEVDATDVYVQQQILYTVKLHLATQLVDGSISDPAPENTVVKRIGSDRRYESRRGNQNYQVFERRFVLFPQKSGLLKIPPVRFQGRASDGSRANQQLFNSLFDRGRKIRANSSTLQVNVKPPAASFTGSTWLPAKKIQINEVGDTTDQFQVGQPVTRKIQLQALGLTAEQLPEITFNEVAGVKFYPDQGVLESQDSGEDVLGIQLKNIAMVPGVTGNLVLPGITVNWWNTETDSMEQAILPERHIAVGGAPVNESTKPQTMPAGAEGPKQKDSSLSGPEADEPTLPQPLRQSEDHGIPWKWLAIAMAGLWVLTVIWMRWRLMSLPAPPAASYSQQDTLEPNQKQLLADLRKSCESNDLTATRMALLRWGQKKFDGVEGLAQLSDSLGQPELTKEINLLDQSLYSSAAADEISWSGKNLWSLLSKYQQSKPKPGAAKSALEPLYP